MKFLENIERWKTFPDTKLLAYYHSLGNYICLNEYEDFNEFEESSKKPELDRNRYSVFVHEYQHYIDQITTLWGIRNIYKIYRAFDSAIKQDEFLFYRNQELSLTLKRDYFLDYYTQTFNHIKGDFENRWTFNISFGLRFQHSGKVDKDRPIPFMTFYSNKGEKISRVPLSVVSLLETTASYAEYDFQINAIRQLGEKQFGLQIQKLNKKFEDNLYHPGLTFYSAAVHLTAVNLKIKNPIIGYKISSIFAKIALNIPSSLVQNIPITDECKSDEEWTRRSERLLENENKGFIFYLLIRNYFEKYGSVNEEIDVENILDASGLPNEKEVEKEIIKEIEALEIQTLGEKNSFGRQIVEKVFFGNKFRKQTGLGQQNSPEDVYKHTREKPFLIFNSTYFEYEDLELGPIIRKVIKQEELTIPEWFRIYTFCENRMDAFTPICGV